MVWHHRVYFVLAVVLASFTAGPAYAQSPEITAALTEASKLLQRGGYVKVIEIIDTTLRSGKIQSDLAAKALLMRAEANEKLGRTAFALADYNSAVWMQGLSATDRKRAEEGYSRVMKGLGVADRPSEPAPASASREAPAQPSAPASTSPGRARAPASWNTGVQEEPSEERTGGAGSIFSGLFGSSSKPKQEASSTAAAVATTAPAPEPRPTKVGPPKVAAKPSPVAASQPPASAAARAPEAGSFNIQFAALAEEDKAIGEADRIGKKFAADLNGRTPSLSIVPTSDGGTLYKVVAGPFETKGEGVAVCELLKTKGLSCMVISRK